MSELVIPDEPREPSLEHVIQLALEAHLDGVRVGLPGIITEYDKDQQRASVQPLVQHGYVLDGVRRVETLPIIHDTPVRFPGAGTTRTTYPVKVGTIGWINFASSSLAVYLETGGIVDPDDDRRHDINDAVFEPGLHTFNAVPSTAPDDAMVHWAGDFDVRIGGYDSVEPIMLGDQTATALDTFATAVGTALAAVGLTGPAAVAFGNAVTSLATALASAKSSTGKVAP